MPISLFPYTVIDPVRLWSMDPTSTMKILLKREGTSAVPQYREVSSRPVPPKRTGRVVVSQRLVRRLVGAMALLLFLSAWRPAPASAASPNLHAHHKRLRKSLSELPESRVPGSGKRDATSNE